jgi:hypothetical protein
MKVTVFLVTMLSIFATIIVGCEKPAQEKAAAPAPASATEQLPPNLIVSAEPVGAVDVVAAKKAAKDGESIVIRGRVGGQHEPLATGRAIMTVIDVDLRTCDKSPMDKCETPWDVCCEPTDQIAAKSLSVQVVGADGRPIKAGLGGVGALAPLKQVVVAGTAKRAAGSDALIIDAKQIFVTP